MGSTKSIKDGSAEGKAEALIIAEITGSITPEEAQELQKLRAASACVRLISEDMHRILDPQIDEIREIRTTSAQKIIALAGTKNFIP
ncbi:hypothetical protein [Chitinophaga sp. CF418]|uniref:hypothetical protein n=1 Tax=Chitinophaga sp. CF418 TaxID=1855287 RepID=UPI000918B921|nr:hypothetical protein [Chitinophaga sp. CF418]SHN45970.1 hypothetical protein SAMN05216311_12255 [Chitinophaga sp. CF418]